MNRIPASLIGYANDDVAAVSFEAPPVSFCRGFCIQAGNKESKHCTTLRVNLNLKFHVSVLLFPF
jgi:hypothetical protein